MEEKMVGRAFPRTLLIAGGRKWLSRVGITTFLLAAVCLTYLISSAEPTAQTEGDWQIETVDDSGGRMNSIAVDDSDVPHISYSLGKLMYTYKDDSGWHGTILKDFGLEPSLTLDEMGYAHICYRNLNQMDYGYQDAEGWNWEWVYKYVKDDSSCSIALDQDSYPRFSFYDSTILGNLIYVHQDSSGWQIDHPDSIVKHKGKYSSLALDKNDHPHISYYAGNNVYDLRYAFQDDNGWHAEPVDTDGLVGSHTSLALDGNGYPHISYFDCGATSDPECSAYDLKYAYKDATKWHTETVDDLGQVGRYTSIALDSNDNPHISYRDDGNEDLKYAFQDSSGWNIETVDSQGDVGTFTSLALGQYGSVHISYFDEDSKHLKYAFKQGTTPPPPPPEHFIFLPSVVSADD